MLERLYNRRFDTKAVCCVLDCVPEIIPLPLTNHYICVVVLPSEATSFVAVLLPQHTEHQAKTAYFFGDRNVDAAGFITRPYMDPIIICELVQYLICVRACNYE